jgi:hypothetical protein
MGQKVGDLARQLCFMPSKQMTSFCKSEDCPSSIKLLEFQSREVPKMTGDKIRRHLATCEFCAAEVSLYSHYPQDEGTSDTAEMTGIPAPLFELAEALLKNRHIDSISLDSLLKRKTILVP